MRGGASERVPGSFGLSSFFAPCWGRCCVFCLLTDSLTQPFPVRNRGGGVRISDRSGLGARRPGSRGSRAALPTDIEQRLAWPATFGRASQAPTPRSLILRLANALVRLAAVAADHRPRTRLKDGVLDAGRPAARRADEHDVRVVQRRLEVDHATLRDADARARAACFGVALQDVDALDDDLVLVGEGAEHLALLALVLARDHDHGIAGREVEPAALGFQLVAKHLEDLRSE